MRVTEDLVAYERMIATSHSMSTKQRRWSWTSGNNSVCTPLPTSTGPQCTHHWQLKWTTHIDSVVKNVQQSLFNLRRLKKCVLSPKAFTNFYRCTNESLLLGCLSSWYGNCTGHNRKALQRTVRSAQRITGGKLPALQDTYTSQHLRKAKKIIKDNNHPSHYHLFTPLPSRRRGQYRCIKAGTERLKNSFYLKAIRLPTYRLKSMATLING